MAQSDEYEARAKECERAAEIATFPEVKEQYRELARQWRELAGRARELRKD